MTHIYALCLPLPGKYIVGRSSRSAREISSSGRLELTDAAHLMVLKEQSVLTPIDVLGSFHACLEAYTGFGVLDPSFTLIYEAWCELRRNPPDFGVQEDE